jgi:hypothetical protein
VYEIALCIQQQSDLLEKFWVYFVGLDEGDEIGFDDAQRVEFTEWRSVKWASVALFPVPSLEYAKNERCSWDEVVRTLKSKYYSTPSCAYSGN